MMRDEMIYPGITKLRRNGFLLVPQQISWTRAHRIVKAGFATIYPFHRRWQGRIDLIRNAPAPSAGEEK